MGLTVYKYNIAVFVVKMKGEGGHLEVAPDIFVCETKQTCYHTP